MSSNKNFTPRLETVMGAKLKQLLPNANKRQVKKKDTRDPMPSPMHAGEDGVDHINIWERGITDLGKLLAHSTQLSFSHSLFGRFSNIEAFWHYIRSEERDDRIRVMTGITLNRFSKKLKVTRVTNFKAIIMDANWQKVKQYPDILEALKQSTLPLECYYIYKRENGVRIRPTFSHWLIQGFNEIRAALKEGREPSFDFMKDKPNIGIYDGVLEVKAPPKPAVETVSEAVSETSVLSEADNRELEARLQATVAETTYAADAGIPAVSQAV